ncbi:MAG: NAD(P)-dependent oxidoreductase [Rhizobiales bacterium]|nr:NAD(P)-dependent oxidoreductase [Hyphomicrobiales bacterium]
MATSLRVAFLGTGLMGAPMVRRLLGDGYPVSAWNRSPEKASILAPEGALVASSAASAVKDADFVITMLSDGSAVADVLFNQGVAAAMKAGTILVDMSSIKPREARDHSARLSDFDIRHIDAPVSGGTLGADAGKLAIMAGGDEAVFGELAGIFGVFGRAILVGPSGSGQLSKLANQAIVAINIGGVAEALLLASAGGADPAKVRAALTGGFADSTILSQHGQRMLTRNFEPGGTIHIQIKDLENVLEEATNMGVVMPLVQSMLKMYQFIRDDLGQGDMDHSAALLGLEAKSKPHRVGSSS